MNKDLKRFIKEYKIGLFICLSGIIIGILLSIQGFTLDRELDKIWGLVSFSCFFILLFIIMLLDSIMKLQDIVDKLEKEVKNKSNIDNTDIPGKDILYNVSEKKGR